MNWRLLLDEGASGAWNMAVDEAILASQASASVPPTLRFYAWTPACISIGRFQRVGEAADGGGDASPWPNADCDWVRRPSGGRAVLHEHEITYSMALPEALLPPNSRGVVGSYRWLSAGLADGLARLGVRAELASGAGRGVGAGATNCFAATAQCDFVVDSRKLIGAAQCRKQGGVLQHGSLLLECDEARWEATLGGSMAKSVSLRLLGVEASRERIVEALCAGVESVLGARLTVGKLSESELELARRLHCGKYLLSSWNRAGKSQMW